MRWTPLRGLARWLALTGSTLGLLAGCATPEQTQRFQEGWKPGLVTAVGTASALGEQHPRLDCRAAHEGDAPDEVFAVVSYPAGRRHLAVVAAVPGGLHAAPSDEVWVNSRHCEPVEPRAHGH